MFKQSVADTLSHFQALINVEGCKKLEEMQPSIRPYRSPRSWLISDIDAV